VNIICEQIDGANSIPGFYINGRADAKRAADHGSFEPGHAWFDPRMHQECIELPATENKEARHDRCNENDESIP
jgi:hypothetical protein